MLNIRKKLDDQYSRVSRAEQEVERERAELRRIQNDLCPHPLAAGDWCEDCDKYLGPR